MSTRYYIHLFSFHVQMSREYTKYIIHNIATVSADNYNNILLGSCLRNMGIHYRAKDYANYAKISRDMKNPLLKVGRFKTRNPTITEEEINTVLQNLGYNLASIYLTENEEQFFEGIFEQGAG